MNHPPAVSSLDRASRILCYYVNATSQLQIARITNIPNWCFERIVFPGQRLLFEAIPDALLEIRTSTAASVALLDHIPCLTLQVQDHIQTALNFPDVVDP